MLGIKEDELARRITESSYRFGSARKRFAAKVGVTVSTVCCCKGGMSRFSSLFMRQIKEPMERTDEEE